MPEHPLSTPIVTAEQLGSIGLFGGLDDETVHVLAKELPCVVYEIGRVVVREGAKSGDMFAVISGELEITKKSGDADVRVALIGPGDWFGDMSILDLQPRSASVCAVAPSLLVKISTEDVDRLLYRRDLRAYSLFMMNIARELSRRLRVADSILAQLMTHVSGAYGLHRG